MTRFPKGDNFSTFGNWMQEMLALYGKNKYIFGKEFGPFAAVVWGASSTDKTPAEVIEYITDAIKTAGFEKIGTQVYYPTKKPISAAVVNTSMLPGSLPQVVVNDRSVKPKDPKLNPDEPDSDRDEPELNPDESESDPDEPESDPDEQPGPSIKRVRSTRNPRKQAVRKR